MIPRQLPRLFALNGDITTYGAWFSRYEQHGISIMLDALADADDSGLSFMEKHAKLTAAAKRMKDLTSDEQAAARRVAVGFVKEHLVNEETVEALKSDTSAKAKAGRARRAAYWAEMSG